MMRVIFRGEEKRQRAKLEKEASLVHSEALNYLDELQEMNASIDPDEKLLQEIFQKEEEEVMALLASLEETQQEDAEMDDVVMSDIEV